MREHLTLLENDLCDARELLYELSLNDRWESIEPIAEYVTNALKRVRRLALCCRDGVAYPPAAGASAEHQATR